MTQTIDQRARELLAKHHGDSSDHPYSLTVEQVLAALTEALTREAEAVAKVGDRDDTIRNVLNERKAYEARIEELEGALINIGEVDDDGFTSDGHERCAEHARTTLTQGIKE